MKYHLIAALLATAAAAPALAQDGGAFNGARVEGVIGYDSFDPSGNDPDGVEIDDNIDGLVYGVQGGYDFDLGNVVVGVEGEFTDSSGELEDDEDIFSIRAGRDLYVGGRVGFKATPSTLIYGKAGYTNTSIEYDEENGTEPPIELDDEVEGLRLGAGVEQMFGDNLYGKVEYRYSNYSSLQNSGDGTDADVDIDLDRHQVVAGVGMRF